MLREEVSIFVVDDVNSVRQQVTELLREQGFQKITQLANGEEAKSRLEAEPCNLVLCDWHMGLGDGIDLLKFVRAHTRLKDLPFLLLTGEGTKEHVIQGIQSGVDDYLLKPLTAQQIQAKIFGVLLKKKVL